MLSSLWLVVALAITPSTGAPFDPFESVDESTPPTPSTNASSTPPRVGEVVDIICSDYLGTDQYAAVAQAISVSRLHARSALDKVEFGTHSPGFKAFFKTDDSYAKTKKTFSRTEDMPKLDGQWAYPHVICVNTPNEKRLWKVGEREYTQCMKSGYYHNRLEPVFKLLICPLWYEKLPAEGEGANPYLCPHVEKNFFVGTGAVQWPWTRATFVFSLALNFFGDLIRDPAAGSLDKDTVSLLNRAVGYSPGIAATSLLSSLAFGIMSKNNCQEYPDPFRPPWSQGGTDVPSNATSIDTGGDAAKVQVS